VPTEGHEQPAPPSGADPGTSELRRVETAPLRDAGRPTPPPPASPAPDHDPERRAFFRQFSRQAVTTAGQVAGMATVVNRVTGTAVANLLGLAAPPPRGGASVEPVMRRTDPVGSVVTRAPLLPSSRSAAEAVDPSATDLGPSDEVPEAEHRFRSPYRMVGQELMLLDQRAIPEAISEVVAKRGSDVAYYFRLGLVRGGALLAQLAAIGLSLTAQERAEQPAAARDSELRRTAEALVQARPSMRLVGWAIERMERRRATLGSETDGATVAAALRTEAGAIAAELQAHHAAMARTLAEVLARLATDAPGRPLGVLVHGDPGALSSGLVGIVPTALRRLRDDGQALRIVVTETRPFMDGARLASWELRQAGLDHKVVTDAAVAWLLQQEPIDVLIVSAEWVAANGDCAGVSGSRGVVLQAVALPGWSGVSQPAVVVCALAAAVDMARPDGDAIPVELRPARESVAYLAGVPLRASDVVAPACDIIPAAAISALVTERGVVAPVTPEGIASLVPEDARPSADEPPSATA
jgi:methylthioribose-1-phosphate isomerase